MLRAWCYGTCSSPNLGLGPSSEKKNVVNQRLETPDNKNKGLSVRTSVSVPFEEEHQG